MEKIIILMFLLALISCKEVSNNPINQTHVKELDLVKIIYTTSDGQRIKLKELVNINDNFISIIEIDSIEYIMTSKGGVIKLEK